MKILHAFCVFVFAASPAFAADLPSRVAPPVYVLPVVPATWTGCYAGGFGAIDIAHVGDQTSESRSNGFTTKSSALTSAPFFRFDPGPPPSFKAGNTFTRTTTVRVTTEGAQSSVPYGRTLVGGDGGGRVGCNYQTGRFVVGAQLEGGYLGVNGTSYDPRVLSTASSVGGGAYGAVTGRVGYAVFERTLLYVRGGVGYANLKFSTYDRTFGFYESAHSNQAIPLVGAGIEYKLTPQISVTAEYTYMRPGCRTVGFATAAGTGVGTSTACVDKQMVALGLNYYFTPQAAPVVARY